MGKRSLTDEQIHEICKLLMNGEKLKDIVDRYNVSRPAITNIKYKKSYREITSLYDLEETWTSRNVSTKLYSDEFIDFILECIKNNTLIDKILSDERCKISDKDSLSHYISKIRTGRLYRNRLIKNKIYNDNINDPINNDVNDEIAVSIANEIKANQKISNKELAEKYNLNSSSISNIRNGRTHSDATTINIKQYALISHTSNQLILQIANEIKANPKISNKELAKKYNVTEVIIYNIRNGRTHSDITGIKKVQSNSILSNDIIISIANEIKANPKISNKELSEKYNLSQNTISNIRNGKIYSDITGIKKGQYNLYKNKEIE